MFQSNSSVLSGLRLDPLDVSALLPGGELHLAEQQDWFSAELWMWEVAAQGLRDLELHQLRVLRDNNLTR